MWLHELIEKKDLDIILDVAYELEKRVFDSEELCKCIIEESVKRGASRESAELYVEHARKKKNSNEKCSA